MFTNRDTDLIILSKLNDKDLLSTCLVNKSVNRLCQDENFWRNRFISKYGQKDFEMMKDKVVSWRKFMLLLIKYMSVSKNNFNVALVYAALEGYKEIVEFFILKEADNFEEAMEYAARGGHKDLVDFFISKGAKGWDWGMEGAARGGHRDLIDFFISKGAKDWNRGMAGAAIGGHRDLVDFFISKGADYWELGMNYAREGGHKELVDFFIFKERISKK
jgi:hypothetical protein